MTTRVKQPGESLLFAVDFVNLLATGDSLDSITSIESSPTGLTFTDDETISGTEVQFTIAGGTDKTTYHLEVTVGTANGETLEGDGYLYVTDTPESELEFNYNYTALKVAIADYLGWGRNTEGTGTSWSSTDESRMDAIIKSALAQVYFPTGGHRWSWTRPTSTINTVAPYATGTIGIVAGVVTLTDGTFPSWAADGELEVAGGIYAIASRDGDTQITLTDTSVAVDAGTSYSLSQYLYDLPTDFAGLEGDMTYSRSDNVLYPPVELTSDSVVRKMRQQTTSTSWPRYAAMRPATFDADAGQQWQMAFYPTPDAAYTLEYRYRVRPTMLNEAYPNPMGGPEVGELILEACLAVAEQRYKDEAGLHTQAFQEKLATAIRQDVVAYSPDTLGYNADRSDTAHLGYRDDIAIHSFDGVVYYDRNP